MTKAVRLDITITGVFREARLNSKACNCSHVRFQYIQLEETFTRPAQSRSINAANLESWIFLSINDAVVRDWTFDIPSTFPVGFTLQQKFTR